ncbi:Ig-like domain-containing protein [Syntrophomonas wolfei]|uniref:Ig-like domain-containing protein n=1 Tax=Syntrophomonas wolfei TaxID=863 RepID=UPI000773A43F|nr:Ig-like domain-containing protein [Syntrophomonas wolfei]
MLNCMKKVVLLICCLFLLGSVFCVNQVVYGIGGAPAAGAGLQLELTPSTLTAGYSPTSMLITNNKGTALWQAGDRLGLQVMKLTQSGQPTVAIPNIRPEEVLDKTMQFTLAGGLEAGDYIVGIGTQDGMQLGYVMLSIKGAGSEDFAIKTVSPGQGAAQVSRYTTVEIEFSAPADDNTLNNSSITITNQNTGSTVSDFSVNYDAGNYKAIIFLATPLDMNSSYTVQAGTGVKSLDGIALKTPFTWSFTISSEDLPPGLFTIEVKNGHGNWIPASNLAESSLGVYYYFPGQSIDLRLKAKANATLPPDYSLSADLSSIIPSLSQPLNYDEASGYWQLSYRIPANVSISGPCEIIISTQWQGEPFPAAIMMAIMNINPKDFNMGLAGDTTDWSTIKDFTCIPGLVFERWDNGMRIARLELGDAQHPINLCGIDDKGNPTTAAATQELGKNMELAYGKMSMDMAVEGMAAMNLPATITMHNIQSKGAPGVKYTDSDGLSQVAIRPGDSNPSDLSGKISDYNWDSANGTLTIKVNGWSAYEIIPVLDPPSGSFKSRYDTPKTAPNRNHSWTVKFSAPVDFTSLNALSADAGILVLNEANQQQMVSFAPAGQDCIKIIAPNGGYSPGTYTIYIRDTLRSAAKPAKALKEPIKFTFIVS